MKKSFFYLSMVIVAVSTAISLTSCGEEVALGEQPAGSKEGLTVFSSVADVTRTTMDATGLFYWQSEQKNGVVTDDQIWIDEAGDGTSFSLRSSSSQFGPDKRTGKFYFGKQLGAKKYKLSYTGFKSATGDEVTIAKEQQQSKWNNSDHIGTSGDCATAEADRDDATGNYTFTLGHKSSYLIFQPYAKKATPGSTNFYRLTEITITDMDGHALCGTFPLKYDGLKTDGATYPENANEIRLTCSMGFHLPENAPADTATVYAVILPRDFRNLRVKYHVVTTSDGEFDVYETISGAYQANDARLVQRELSVPVTDPTRDPDFISDGNGTFGGTKFKPAFLFRTNGNATTGTNLLQLAEMKDDPFILLQYNQGAQNATITEFQKRMFFNWNELAEIFGHAAQGQGANWATTTATAASITKSVTIPTNGGKQYRLPTMNEYARLIETPNSGRATVNYYPASYAAVKVDLSADATYASKGWDHTRTASSNVNANYIMGYLFFPDGMVVLASKMKVASLNGRWLTLTSNLTAAELKAYTDHGCMFLPPVGYSDRLSWYHRGLGGFYWSGSIYGSLPSTAYIFSSNGLLLSYSNISRSSYFPAMLVEN